MIFHSFDFLVFLVCVLSMYWLLGRVGQNILLLVGSYFFYGYVHPWFLYLILASTLVDYCCGRLMGVMPERKKLLLWCSLVFNLGMLGVFKYFNFFADNLGTVFSFLGLSVHPSSIAIFLPVGISFYTFQTLSYTLDIYRGELQPRRSLLDVAVFVAFFPQLVAGPIERAQRFLPQVEREHRFSARDAEYALGLIVWGYFKKLVIADNVALTADKVFSLQSPSFYLLWVGVFAFCIQIYADFSAYTDIARGVARLLGFRLTENFNHPYLALSPADFWRRWHISLSEWFRDYVYIPLGGSRASTSRWMLNVLVVFGLSGLWHGASWNFVLWGTYWGFLLIIYGLLERVLPTKHLFFRALKPLGWVLMFILINAGWLFFRERDFSFILHDLSLSPFDVSAAEGRAAAYLLAMTLVFTLPLMIHSSLYLLRVDRMSGFPRLGFVGRGLSLALLFVGILLLRNPNPSDFIYFQF